MLVCYERIHKIHDVGVFPVMKQMNFSSKDWNASVKSLLHTDLSIAISPDYEHAFITSTKASIRVIKSLDPRVVMLDVSALDVPGPTSRNPIGSGVSFAGGASWHGAGCGLVSMRDRAFRS